MGLDGIQWGYGGRGPQKKRISSVENNLIVILAKARQVTAKKNNNIQNSQIK